MITQHLTGNVIPQYNPVIVKLTDPSFYLRKQTLTDLDYTTPFTEPTIDHLLLMDRPFTESEKYEIWTELEILRQTNQLQQQDQGVLHRQKAVDVGIHLLDFEYTRNGVKAKCKI